MFNITIHLISILSLSSPGSDTTLTECKCRKSPFQILLCQRNACMKVTSTRIQSAYLVYFTLLGKRMYATVVPISVSCGKLWAFLRKIPVFSVYIFGGASIMHSAAKISSRKVLRGLIGQTTRKHRQLYKRKQRESSDIQYQKCETYMKSYQQPQNDGLWCRGNKEGDRWSYELFDWL